MKKSTSDHSTHHSASAALDPILINNKVYVKDISFENPGILQVLSHPEQKPDIQINLQVGVNSLQENAYEVVLSIQAKAMAEKKHIFLLEVAYAGIFAVTQELEEEELKPLLLINGPTYLFPFARALISHLTQEGGLPSLLLNSVDFEVLYREQNAEEKSPSKK